MNYAIGGERFFNQLSSTIQTWFWPSQANQHAPKLLTTNLFLYVVIFLVMIKLISAAVYIPFPHNFFFADVTKIDLLNLVNANRANQGLKPLAENATLDQAAYLKAQDMIEKGYFAHQSPSGTTPWFWFLQAGYKYVYAGENLAVGFINSPDVFDAWKRSPSHWANIVSPNYDEMGIAVVPGFGTADSLVVVQLFGSADPIAPPATTQKSTPTPAPTPAPAPATPKPNPSPTPTPTPAPLLQPEVTSTPEPVVEEPAAQIPASEAKVLAQSTENLTYTAPGGNTSKSLYFKILNGIVYSNSVGISYAIYALLLIIASCALGYIGFSAVEIDRRLLLKSLVLMTVLSASLFINQSALAEVFGHQVII